ncbi:MAG: hypothetical protein ABWX93_03615 [Pseudoxanthomonas sp.]
MWARGLAGIFPGFLLSAGLVGVLSWLWPGPWQGTVVVGLIAFFLVWMCVIGSSFFFANGKRAWAWISGAALLLLGGLWLMQSLRWIE